MSYQTNVFRDTEENNYFRKVLFTGSKSQLVVMDIKPGENIGKEVHDNVEQIFFVQSGEGLAVLDDVETEMLPGDVLVVTPGTEHDIINQGDESLKIFTVYCPANHIDGVIHETKEDSEADVEDEEFGKEAGLKTDDISESDDDIEILEMKDDDEDEDDEI